eukprot:6455187-Amphidinium_carterae.1
MFLLWNATGGLGVETRQTCVFFPWTTHSALLKDPTCATLVTSEDQVVHCAEGAKEGGVQQRANPLPHPSSRPCRKSEGEPLTDNHEHRLQTCCT